MVASSNTGFISHVSSPSAIPGLNLFITSPAVYAKNVDASQISKLYIGIIFEPSDFWKYCPRTNIHNGAVPETEKSKIYHMSRVMRKPDFGLCENKGADQLRSNCEADQRLCFRYSDSTIPLLLIAKISSL